MRAVFPFFPIPYSGARLKTCSRCILEYVFVSVSTQGILNWSHSRLEWSSHAKLFPEQTYNVHGPFEVETQGAQSKPSRVSFEGTDMKSRGQTYYPLTLKTMSPTENEIQTGKNGQNYVLQHALARRAQTLIYIVLCTANMPRKTPLQP